MLRQAAAAIWGAGRAVCSAEGGAILAVVLGQASTDSRFDDDPYRELSRGRALQKDISFTYF